MSDAPLPKRTGVKEEIREVKKPAPKPPKATAEEHVPYIKTPMPPAVPRPASPVPRPASVARNPVQPTPTPASAGAEASDVPDEPAVLQTEPETTNPADLYALLGVPVDASFPDIKKQVTNALYCTSQNSHYIAGRSKSNRPSATQTETRAIQTPARSSQTLWLPVRSSLQRIGVDNSMSLVR
jgi:hypothetical protein